MTKIDSKNSYFLDKIGEINKNNQKIALVGLGSEILQFFNWLVGECKFPLNQIVVIDQKVPATKEIWCEQITADNIFFNSKDFNEINQDSEIKMVIKAPGIWSLCPQFEIFRKKNGQDTVLSSLTFFIEKFRNKIIGVTGTKGKTTTSSILTHLLTSISDVQYCGNSVGISPYIHWNNSSSLFVIELSSFQLQDLGNAKLSPGTAIITNYFIDHQDVHNSKHEYWDSKNNIFCWQNNETDMLLCSGQFYKHLENESKIELIRQRENCYIVGDLIAKGSGSLVHSKLIGTHNYSNIALSILTFLIFKSKQENKKTDIINNERFPSMGKLLLAFEKDSTALLEINQLMSSFTPVRHRLELVERKNIRGLEIYFYNDSQATAQEPVIAALSGLGEDSKHAIWAIIGGKAKSDDYNLLENKVKTFLEESKILQLNLFDEIGATMDKNLTGSKNYKDFKGKNWDFAMNIFFQEKIDINKIVTRCIKNGYKRLNVVMSPAGSSFNQFTNYVQRGDLFTAWAKNKIIDSE